MNWSIKEVTVKHVPVTFKGLLEAQLIGIGLTPAIPGYPTNEIDLYEDAGNGAWSPFATIKRVADDATIYDVLKGASFYGHEYVGEITPELIDALVELESDTVEL